MNLLLTILQSDWFVIFVVVWAIIAIAIREEREKLMDTIESIFRKKIVFQEDSEPIIRYYARNLLETIAKALTLGILDTAKNLIQKTKVWGQTQRDLFSKSTDKPTYRKMLGAVVLLIVMLFFLYADLIAIFNTLEVYGITSTIPIGFRNYEYAVTFGSFFTIVIAGLILFEIYGRSEFTDMASQPYRAKLIYATLSWILVILGLVVVISLGLIRYRLITNISPLPDANIGSFNDLVMTIVIPLNVIFATALIVGEGLKGLPLFILGLVWIVIGVGVSFLFIFAMVNYVLWFLIDMIYRIILISLYVLFFLIITPLDKIFSRKPSFEDKKKSAG